MRTTVRRVIGESQSKPLSTLRRVLGEEAQGEEADFSPLDSAVDTKAEIPPAANAPSDGDFNSLADVKQHQADTELGRQGMSSALSTVMAMWRSGGKYDTADYLLKSDFSYADFVRMVRMLPVDEAIELGTILDELVPPAPDGDKPVDMVSAVSGIAAPRAGNSSKSAPAAGAAPETSEIP